MKPCTFLNIVTFVIFNALLFKLAKCSDSSDLSESETSSVDCGNDVVSADEARNDSGWDTGRDEPAGQAQTRKRIRAQVIERAFVDLRRVHPNYLTALARSTRKNKFNQQNKWIKAADSYTFKDPNDENSVKAKRMGDWVGYYLFIQALKQEKIKKAWKLLKGRRASGFTDEVKGLMKGGPSGEYESAFLILHKACVKNPRQPNYCRKIRNRLANLLYNVEDMRSSHDADFRAGRLLNPATITANNRMGMLYAVWEDRTIIAGTGEFPFNILKAAVEADWIDIVHILLLKYIRKHFNEDAGTWDGKSFEKLAEVGLYSTVKSVPMVKLLKKLNVPVLSKPSELTRNHIYEIQDQNKRAQMLGLIKKDGTQYDKERYKEITGGDENATLKELIMSRNTKLVESYFLKPDPVRTNPSDILSAIKFANTDILTILLEERLDLPGQDEIDDAVRMSRNSKELFVEKIDHYRRNFYGADGRMRIPAEAPVAQVNGMTLFNLPVPILVDAPNGALPASHNHRSATDILNAYNTHECTFFDDLVASKRAGERNPLARFSQIISNWLSGYM